MSLTSIIKGKQFQELRDKFKEDFPRPNFDNKSEIISQPLTSNNAIVGQAFDYLLRFNLEYKYREKVISDGSWVADTSYRKIYRYAIKSDAPEIYVGSKRDIPKDRKGFIKMVESEYLNAKRDYESYLKDGKLTDELLKSCLFLARLDLAARVKIIDGNLGNENDLDIMDLTKLYYNIDPEHFHVEKYCYINPTFGDGSRLVGGADADLIIDGTLIDLKVTKHLKLEREYLNQTLGYYILSLIGGINQDPLIRPIQNIGIYFARHCQLWKSPLTNFANEKTFDDFKDWFSNYIEQKLRS